MQPTEKQKNTAAAFIREQLAQQQKPNALIREKSPYLLQHAFNPVHWFPWGTEAFEKARREKKPIFLSIGYSTCHWCHVMERESFENPEIAAILNRYFISIKVDREERPDLDQVYMAFTQAMTGGGGWPMSVFLTPDLQPFYAGTYFPPQRKYGHPGFGELLTSIQEAWSTDQEGIAAQAAAVTAQMTASVALQKADGMIDAKAAARAADQFVNAYDPVHGGFGRAPKFPRPVACNFLFRYAARTKDKRVRDLVLQTLRSMAAGGIYDHLGGGFHRYSVDGQWRVPHFEKMLYDQALLATAYIEAFQVSKDNFFADIAAATLEYVLREMRGPEGGFYSAEDADSPLPDNGAQKGEGAFYLWKGNEVQAVLPPESAAIFSYYYGLEPQGNALADPHGDFADKNILYQAHTLHETATHFAKNRDETEQILGDARQKLLAKRQERPRPHLDDKVLASWNGLMISALARGYQVFQQQGFLDGAESAANFMKEKMYDAQTGTLVHRYRDGDAGIEGQLDDYVFAVQGFLDLYEASFDQRWLALALKLTEMQLAIFADTAEGGFFESSGRDSTVLFRLKGDYDGAEPAANSIAALNLLRLGRMIGSDDFIKKAEETMRAFSGQVASSPTAMPQMLVASEFWLQKPTQIVLAGLADKEDTRRMQKVVGSFFLPQKVMLLAEGEKPLPEMAAQLAFLEFMPMRDGKATAYVCENFTCRQPTTSIDELKRIFDEDPGLLP